MPASATHPTPEMTPDPFLPFLRVVELALKQALFKSEQDDGVAVRYHAERLRS